ncbi:MAG TPA: DUF3738 domain-containing protein [Saprospiraceae bacterium]|nr:DUF3738 domain-containing protein [Saprospiraceae bacterium]
MRLMLLLFLLSSIKLKGQSILNKSLENIEFSKILNSDITSASIAAQFPHRTISHSVIIDKNSVVIAVTTPEKINDNILNLAITDQPIDLPEKIDILNFDPSVPLSGNENFTYQITAAPYQQGIPSMANSTGTGAYKGRRILCTNLSPTSLYEIAFQFPVGTRTIVEVANRDGLKWNEQTAICFDLIVPIEMGEKRFEIMQQQLNILYPYKVTIEKRKMDCHLMIPIPGKEVNILSAAGGEKIVSYGGRGLSMKNAEINTICNFLESMMNIPVIDETQLSGLYNAELNWYYENPGHIHEELKKLGLKLVKSEVEIEVLVIADGVSPKN